MVSPIHRGETLIDYIDTQIQYNEVYARPLLALSLNKSEWLDFVNLIEMDYLGAKAFVNIDIEKGTNAQYKNIYLYCNGVEEYTGENYIMQLQDMRNTLERNRQENLNADNEVRPGAVAQQNPRNRATRNINTVVRNYITGVGIDHAAPARFVNTTNWNADTYVTPQAEVATPRLQAGEAEIRAIEF